MSPLKKHYYALKYLGPRFIGQRAGVYLHQAVGMTRRRFKPRPWDRIDLSLILQPATPTDAVDCAGFKRDNPPAFLFPLGEPPSAAELDHFAGGGRKPALAERAKLLVEDRCVYFLNTPSPEAIDWHRNPFEGRQSDPGKTWCDIPDSLPQQGDARALWEPSRAAWAIDIARGRGHGVDSAWGELFWRWVDSWMAANPPFMGFQPSFPRCSCPGGVGAGLAGWSGEMGVVCGDRGRSRLNRTGRTDRMTASGPATGKCRFVTFHDGSDENRHRTLKADWLTVDRRQPHLL